MKKLTQFILLILLFTVNKISAQTWNQIIKTVASDRAIDNNFGSVAISGNYAVIGAPGNNIDESNKLAGAAYIIKNNSGTWTQVQKIVASDREKDDNFGYSVSISGDYVVVGAYGEDHDKDGADTKINAGSAYIFKKDNGGTWSQIQKIVADVRSPDDNFGCSVSISGDYIIVGASAEDEDATGLNNLTDAGAAYIFKNTEGIWNEVQKIVSSDRELGDSFGYSVSISGDYAIIAAVTEDHDAAGESFLNGAGSAYIFKNNTGNWNQIKKVVSSDRAPFDNFGYSVSISGDYAVVGAWIEDENALGLDTKSAAGSAYIFKNSLDTWNQVKKIVASDRIASDQFGISVSVSGDYLIVGANYADISSTDDDNAGAAYIFKNNSDNWDQIQKISASDRAANDCFGTSVSISGNYAIVGAWAEDHDALGNTMVSSAGSAYLYSDPALLPVELTSFNVNANANDLSVLINWQTATEKNNYGFEIQCKDISGMIEARNRNWRNIGFVQGHGNSSSPKEYSFYDKPIGGRDFKYRLKQIDIDGQYEYSPEVEVHLGVSLSFLVKQNFPNPFNPTTKIEFSIPSDNNVEIKIFNSLGMEIATLLNEYMQAGMHKIDFNANNLSSGIYFYKIVSGKNFEIKKMMILK